MNNCETCTKGTSVPYYVHENLRAQMMVANRRLWVLLLVMLFLFVGTNVAWILYESQFEDVEITQENERGVNNFIGNDGDINNYGEAEDQDSTP